MVNSDCVGVWLALVAGRGGRSTVVLCVLVTAGVFVVFRKAWVWKTDRGVRELVETPLRTRSFWGDGEKRFLHCA